MARFVREHGFHADNEVPRHWYQEPGINTIKDMAVAVGALEQYQEDYTHLSGIEHTDITATIVQDLCGARYADFVAIKSSYVFVAVLDFSLRICSNNLAGEFEVIVAEFNALTDMVTRRECERDAEQ